jgi:hypothetical protein
MVFQEKQLEQNRTIDDAKKQTDSRSVPSAAPEKRAGSNHPY